MLTRVDFTTGQVSKEETISLAKLKQSTYLPQGLIEPAVAPERELAEDHDAEPIRRPEDIVAIARYFADREQWRNYMMFIVGINMGLRVSDLLTLRFSDIIGNDMAFKESFGLVEKKTSNTRRVRKNRYVTINQAVRSAVTIYLEHTPGVRLSDYMFRSESNNGKNEDRPMHRNSVERIIKKAVADLGMPYRVATHTLRKTFGLHFMRMNGNDPRALLLLQKVYGHSSSTVTLAYIGITREEIEEAYAGLNLGSEANDFIAKARITESESA